MSRDRRPPEIGTHTGGETLDLQEGMQTIRPGKEMVERG
jgi:hypothetical protein